MPTRSVLTCPDWASAYITSVSSGFGIKDLQIDLPLPTLPNGVSESISLNTQDQQIVARSAPIVSYISTGARVVSFTIALSDQYMPVNASTGKQYSLHEYIDALKSLEYPNYLSNEIVVPQVVLKVANIKLKGICTSVSVTWGGPVSNALYGQGSSGTFTRADVSLSFKEVSNIVKGSIDIKGGNY